MKHPAEHPVVYPFKTIYMKYFKNPEDSYKGLIVVSENQLISVVISGFEKSINIIQTNHGDIDAHTIDSSWIEIQEEEADSILDEARTILNEI